MPPGCRREDVPEDFLESERKIVAASDEVARKPENIRDKIIEARCPRCSRQGGVLLEQPYVKDESGKKKVSEVVAEVASAMKRTSSFDASPASGSAKRTKAAMRAAYRRVLLKLSGEIFSGSEGGFGIDAGVGRSLATQVAGVQPSGWQIAVVVGGATSSGAPRRPPWAWNGPGRTYMGMLATVINALALADALGQIGSDSRVQSAIWMQEVAEPFIRGRAIRHLEKDRIVIFRGGTATPISRPTPQHRCGRWRSAPKRS